MNYLRHYIEEELNKDFQLLKQYDDEKRHENDPGLRSKWENKIQLIKQEIKKGRQTTLHYFKYKLLSSHPLSSPSLASYTSYILYY